MKEYFNSDIIQGYKTYKYLKEIHAEKFDSYYIPVKNPKPHWIKFNSGRTMRYYDNLKKRPIDPSQPLTWGLVSGKWHVVVGGHTIRVRKDLIKNRIDDNLNSWNGWTKINL